MKRHKKEIQPHWRPNFVNPSELPDIKVVRTNFIVNSVAVVLALGMLFLIGQREYKARTLESTIVSLEARVAQAEAGDTRYLRLSGEFKEAAEHVLEVSKFTETPFLVHELIRTLSVIKPEDLIFRSISISETVIKQGKKDVISYRINLNGDAKSLTVLDQFKGILAQAEPLRFPGYRIEIDETLEGRNEQTGIFPYRMRLSFIPDAANQKQGKDAS